MPANTYKFFQALLKVVLFNYVDTDGIHRKMFQLQNEEAYKNPNDKFVLLGYQTTNLIYNLNTNFAYVYIYPGLIVCLILISQIKIKL